VNLSNDAELAGNRVRSVIRLMESELSSDKLEVRFEAFYSAIIREGHREPR